MDIVSTKETRITEKKIIKEELGIKKLKEKGWLSEEELAIDGFKYLNDYLDLVVYKKEPDEKNMHYFFSKITIPENGSFTNMYKLLTTSSSYHHSAQNKQQLSD